MAFKPLAVFCLALPIWTWNTWIHGASQCFVNPRPKLPVGPVPPVRHVGPAGAVFRNSTWSARSVGFGTVRFANSAVLLVVAVFLVALKKPAVSAWVGFVMHALTTGIMRGFPCPIKIPVSFRREARSNLAKSYIAQAILLSLVLTSQSPTSAMVSKYLLFVLIFVTSIFFDWPDPPLLDQAPALVFPGAIPTKSEEAESGDDRSASSKFIMRLVGILLLTKLLSSQTRESALSWGAAFFAHCLVIYLAASRTKRR